MRLCLPLLLAAALLASPGQAQLRLPGLGVPALPGGLDRFAAPSGLPPLSTQPLEELRRRVVRDLLRDHPGQVEADPTGEPVRRAELLLVSPRPATLQAALALGFEVLRDTQMDALGVRSVVLRPPPGLSTAEALARLRALDPQLDADFNHLYTRSGEPGTLPGRAAGGARRVGLIDSGIDVSHPALRDAALRPWGCAGLRRPSPHGTAVASLLVGHEGAGAAALPGATLYAADVYCDEPAGGSVEAVVQAMAWLAAERVGVINISLVGPPNRLLESAVRAVSARGHLVVAAVGNDGPAAPPLYPAAYPEAIGVTGVNGARQALPEAAQGEHVRFAAPGADLAVARAGRRDHARARGTSFAAPQVAAALARALPEPDPAGAARAVQALAAQAIDLGAPGRDPVYGWGLVIDAGAPAARNGKQM